MINKVLKLFPILIISVLISMNLSNSVYAVDESIACRVDFGKTYPITPSNPLPGQEITIQPVIKDITYPIAMVSFVIEYDSTKIEFSRSAIASVEKSEEELKAIEEAKKAEAEAKKAKKAKKNDADADAKEEKTEVSVETPSEENTETK